MSKIIKPIKGEDLDGDVLSTLVQWFEESEEVTSDARKRSERDRDYYDGKQLTAKEIKTLRDRGQPDIVANRIGPKIDFVAGLESQQRTDPKAFPRNPQDVEAADAATDALRYVKDKEDLDQTFSSAYEDMLIEGMSGVEVHVKEARNGRKEIDIKVWDFDRLFYDPHSHRHDFADARYMGGVVWMDREQAENEWPKKKDIIQGTVTEEANYHFKDKPEHKVWSKPGDRPRLRIVQMYWRDGDQWKWATFTKGGVLDGGEVPYQDEDGNSENPLIMQSAFVDRENARYGAVRRLIGPQDEINKRRSKLLHLISVRQTVYEKGAVQDINNAKAQLARADGAVEVMPAKRFEILDPITQVQGQSALLAEAKNEIEAIGPNASLQGKSESGSSGRAILANQQGGIIELAKLTDRHKHLKRRVYRAIWNRIRQYWDDERWVRVTDNEDNVKFVGLNRRVTAGEMMVRQAVQEDGMSEDEAEAQIQQLAQQQGRSEELNQVVAVENVPARMDMDITIEEAPDTVNIAAEQFEQILALAQGGVPIPPDVILKASSLRNKDELIERLEASEEQQQLQQIAMASAQAEAQKTQAEANRAEADAMQKRADAFKTMAEADALDGQIDGQIG